MGGCKCMREGYDSQHLRYFPDQNIILMHYMLSVMWIHLISGLGNYFVRTGAIEEVLMMTINLMNLSYTNTRSSLNNPPYILFTLTYFGRIITRTHSSSLDLLWRYQSLNRPIPTMVFTITENKDGMTDFDTSTWFTVGQLPSVHTSDAFPA